MNDDSNQGTVPNETTPSWSPRLRRLLALSLGLFLALGLTMGGVGPALANPSGATQVAKISVVEATGASMGVETPLSGVLAGPVADSVVADNTWLSKTRAFTACIFSVGIPIGAAIAIVTTPAVFWWMINRGGWPGASVGAAAARWLNFAKRNCAYALF